MGSCIEHLTRGRNETKQKTKQKEQSLKRMNALTGPLKMDICSICLKKFDHIEEMGKHVLSKHRKKGEIA
jgi:hypothetical protein